VKFALEILFSMAKQQGKNSDKQVKRPPAPVHAVQPFLFERKNYMFLLLGLGIMAIGFLLMLGGSQPPTQFDPNVVYSFRRTTLSTIFVTIGFLVVLYSIFVKPSVSEQK
jgi:hypothetical protein